MQQLAPAKRPVQFSESQPIEGFAPIAKPQESVFWLWVLEIHLLIQVLQIPLRALVLDTTYWRDVLLFPLLAYGLYRFIQRHTFRRGRVLGWCVLVYLQYGVVQVFIWTAAGMPFERSGANFRTYFLPAGLYLAAVSVLDSKEKRAQFSGFLHTVTFLLLVDVLTEFALLSLGVPGKAIPWYQYIYSTGLRYVGSAKAESAYIDPDIAGQVLGVLGWQHATAATLVGLFAFTYTQTLHGQNPLDRTRQSWLVRSSGIFKAFLSIAFMFAIVILNVKTHFLTAVILVAVVPLVRRPSVLIRNLILAGVVAAIVLSLETVYYDFSNAIRRGFVADSATTSTLSEITDDASQVVQEIVTAPLGNLVVGTVDLTESLGSEVRLLMFTQRYGVLWLMFISMTYGYGLLRCMRVISKRQNQGIEASTAAAVAALLVVFLIDFGHYARSMYFPNIDIWATMLGLAIVIGTDTAPLVRQTRIELARVSTAATT